MKLSILLVGAMFLTGGALADQVVLSNGDVVTGTDCSIKSGQVHLDTGYSDPLALDLAQVEKIRFGQPVKVVFADETEVEVSELNASAENFSRIVSANLPPVNPLSFSASLGYGMSDGNSNQSSLLVAVNAGYLFEKTARLTLSGLYEYANEKKEGESRSETANNGVAQAKADIFLIGQGYAYALERYSFDRMKDLDRRWEESIGVGYDLLQEDSGYVSVEAGTSYIDSRYEGPIKQHGLYLRLAESGEWKIASGLTFNESIAYQPKFEDFQEYLIDAAASLQLSLTANLYLGLNVIDRYDNSPVAGKKPNDLSAYVSLGYSL